MEFTQLNGPLEEPSRRVGSLEDLLQGLISQYNNGMGLEIVAKLSSGNQKGISELLYFQVFGLGPHKNFVDVVYRLLDFALFPNKHCAYCYWIDGQVYYELFACGGNCKQRCRAEMFLQLLECYLRFLCPLERLVLPQDLKEREALVSRFGDESIKGGNFPGQLLDLVNVLGRAHSKQSLNLVRVCLYSTLNYEEA